jgi:death-on-curing protein
VDEPTWVPRAVVNAAHHAQLDEHGGAHGIRDENLLESALARPRHRFHYEPETDLAGSAAAYAFGIATSHPFVDGNKRTAFVVAAMFLELNGHDIDRTDQEVIETMLALAAGEMTETELAAWFRESLRPLPPEPEAGRPG